MGRVLRLAVMAAVVYVLLYRRNDLLDLIAELPSGVKVRVVERDDDRCDPSYPTVCIPPPPPFLRCADINARTFKVEGRDPHLFDPDRDGIGCKE